MINLGLITKLWCACSKVVRLSIAQVLTVISQTQKATLREAYSKKKYMPLDLRPKKTRAIRRRLTKHQVFFLALFLLFLWWLFSRLFFLQKVQNAWWLCYFFFLYLSNINFSYLCTCHTGFNEDREAKEEGSLLPHAEVCSQGLGAKLFWFEEFLA